MRRMVYRGGDGPRGWGRAHGESFRGEIRALAELRWYLTSVVGGIARADAERLASMHRPVLEAFDRALHEELLGIAEGAALRPEDVVVLNHYTDLRDIDPTTAFGGTLSGPPLARAGKADKIEDGCSALWARPRAGGPILAQTWDMHASALPFVMLLEVPDSDSGPGGVFLSLTGGLGLCGLNQHGVGMTINNLTSTDARVGVVWPALVRRALREPTAAAARDVVLAAPLGSGHHYLAADPHDVFAVETSGALRKVVFAGGADHFVHTNHCLDGEVDRCSKVAPGSTTFERYDRLRADVEARPIRDVDDAYRRLGSTDGWPRSVCANLATPEKPHLMATCGAIAMDLDRRTVLTVAGFPHNVEPERLTLESSDERAAAWFFTWSAQRGATPLAIASGEGAWFTTTDGARWLDLAAFSYQASLGHGHPRMIEAICRQARELCMAPPNADFPAKRETAEELLRLAGPAFAGGKVFFTLGGAEANENAMKMARLATGRWKFVSRYRGYHGATMGALSLTGDYRRPVLEPGLPGVIHLCADDPAQLAAIFAGEGPGSIAAVFLEPVPGANGVYPTTPAFWQEVRRLCDAHGALLVADEVLTGFGRTGTCFAYEWLGAAPDLLTLSKALTAGYAPLGAVVVSPRLTRHFDDHVLWGGLTYYANPLGVAAAREAMTIYREEGTYTRATTLEPILRGALDGLVARGGAATAARVKGALACLDLTLPPAGWAALGRELAERRVLVHDSQKRGTVILSPPLVISEADLVDGLARLTAAVSAAEAAR